MSGSESPLLRRPVGVVACAVFILSFFAVLASCQKAKKQFADADCIPRSHPGDAGLFGDGDGGWKELGETCADNAECATHMCEAFGRQSICTAPCSNAFNPCGSAGLACFDGRCAPRNYCKDQDMDGWGEGPGCNGPDCDDMAVEIHPAAAERCGNHVDDNCNGAVDESFPKLGRTCTAGKGSCRRPGRYECTQDRKSVTCSAKPASAQMEICDGMDNDCDGKVDSGLTCNCTTGETQPCYPAGAKTRGVGICRDGIQTCRNDGTWGTCKNATTPGSETCNGLDDDCNGLRDDVDSDGDSYFACPGVAERDCNDQDRSVHPQAVETCNSKDDNCNGVVDEGVQGTFYLDNDGDGWRRQAATQAGCNPPRGFVQQPGDCDDFNSKVHPNQAEICNRRDDDCDGKVDEGLPEKTVYRDHDYDGYAPRGAPARKTCLFDTDGDGVGDSAGPGWATKLGDCDDLDSSVHKLTHPKLFTVKNKHPRHCLNRPQPHP